MYFSPYWAFPPRRRRLDLCDPPSFRNTSMTEYIDILNSKLRLAEEKLKEEEIFGSDIDVAMAQGRIDAIKSLIEELSKVRLDSPTPNKIQ